MAFKDLYKHAKQQEEKNKAPEGAKSSQEIRQDAISRDIKGARSLGIPTTEAILQEAAAAKTQAVLGKALAGTTDPMKQDQLTSAIRAVAEDLNRKSGALDLQKKKEDQQAAKTPADALPSQKQMAEDRLKHFDENADFDAASAHDRKRYDDQRKRLQMEIDRIDSNAAAQQEAQIRKEDTAVIANMSREDLSALQQYAVNRVRDQNLPVEMAGKMPTAETESAAFIAKYGKQRADELAETFMRQENAQLAQQADAAGRKFSEERPVLASATTVPINLMSGIVGAAGQLQGAARATGRYRSLDANETGTALDTFSGAVRDQTAQNIEGDVYDERGNLVKDGGALRKLGSLAYQGGMSFLDSTARMLVSGGSSGISSAIAASGAFSQGLQKYSAMGATPQQAALAATASAGLEYITEKLPTEQVLKIFHKGGGTSAVKEVLKQAFLVEPTGEEVNLFAGIAAEALILGEKSGRAQRLGDLIAGGMTKAEAEKQFWKETFLEAAETYAVSAVAGGLGAGGAVYAGNQVQAVEAAAAALMKQPEAPGQAAPVTEQQEQLVVDGQQQLTRGADQVAQQVNETGSIKEQIRGSQDKLNAMNPVTSIQTPKGFADLTKTERKNWVIEKLQSTGYQVDRKGFGVIKFAEKQLKAAFKYLGRGSVEEASFEAIPYVLEHGTEISSHPVHKDREYGTVTIAAPVMINGQRGNMAVVVRQTTENFYKVHRILTPDGSVFNLSETTNEAEPSPAGESPETGSLATPISSASESIVSDTAPEVNGNPATESVNFIGEKTATADNAEAVADNLKASESSPLTKDSETMTTEGGQIKGTGAAEANFSGKAAYANLLQEGNVQPDRPGDVRPMEVPKTDVNGKRVTEFAANAYGAGVTTDEMASVIESLIQDGDLGFDVRTNRESLNNAAAVISKKGAAETRNQITRNISKGKIRDGDIEQGILLYSRYAEKGDNDNASEMLVDLAQMANITGRNLQMFKLLRRMTVEGQVMTLEKEVRRSIESMVHFGQVKKGYEPSFDPQMMDGYRKALEELRNAKTPEAQEAAKQKAKQTQEAIYAEAAAKMPATFKAKWDAWRYMAMLGNAKTQIRNIAGNAAFVPYKEVKDKMGALAEKILVPKDQRTKSLTMDRGLIQWAREDRKNNDSVRDALKYSAAIGDDVTSQKIRDDMKVFNTKVLEDLRGFVNKVPQAGDMLFKSGYYERSLAGFLRGRGYNAPDIQNGKVSETVLNEARSYAVQEAMKATFNDCNAFSDFLATELRYQGDNPVGKALNIAAEGVLPFRRTPANIAVRFTEYSPVGVVKGLWNAATKVRSGEMTAATAIDQLTAGLTGSAVMVLGYALAEGLGGVKITGSGTDEDEKRQGHQDYALEFSVDGQEYSYKIDWAAPANLPLFVGANIYNALNGAGEAQDVSAFTSFLRGMQTMFEPLLALSCMSSLNDLLEGIRYAEEGEATYTVVAKAATSYFTQGIPALARQYYQSKQEHKQTTFTTSDDPTIQDLQKTAAGLGVSDAYKTDKVDAWGQKESQGTPLERGINAFLNPGTLKKIDNSAVEKEISRLNAAGYSVSPDTASRTVSYIDKDGYGHDDVRLTEEQFQKLAQTQGQTSRELLEAMFASKDYAAMTDAQKAEALDSAYLYARKTGEIAAIANHTGYDQTWMMDVKKKGANEILRRVLNSDLNGSMSDLDEAWDKGYHEENFDRALQTAYDSFSKATPAMKKQVYNEAEGTTKKYLEARSKGISHIDFVAVAESIAKVKGTGSINKDTGKPTVRDIDRRKAIANTSGMTDKEIDIVMKAYMADYDPTAESPETTEFKYQYAREELGLSPKEYVSTYQAYLDGDKKKDKIAALRELGYDYRTANALYKLYYGRMKNELIELYG